MVDYILAVESPEEWHQDVRPRSYSGLPDLGATHDAPVVSTLCSYRCFRKAWSNNSPGIPLLPLSFLHCLLVPDPELGAEPSSLQLIMGQKGRRQAGELQLSCSHGRLMGCLLALLLLVPCGMSASAPHKSMDRKSDRLYCLLQYSVHAIPSDSCTGQAAWIADNIGAGVHFNPFVTDQRGRAVKYGVLSLEALLYDLTTWRRLYVSGRMHKPVRGWLLSTACAVAGPTCTAS